jgi:hypothetical protein
LKKGAAFIKYGENTNGYMADNAIGGGYLVFFTLYDPPLTMQLYKYNLSTTAISPLKTALYYAGPSGGVFMEDNDLVFQPSGSDNPKIIHYDITTDTARDLDLHWDLEYASHLSARPESLGWHAEGYRRALGCAHRSTS